MTKLASRLLAAAGRCLPLLLLTILSRPSHVLAQRMTLKGDNLAITDVLDKIKEQTHFELLYSPVIFSDAPRMSFHLENASVRRVFSECFAGLRYRVKINYVDSIVTISRIPGTTPYADLVGRVSSADNKEPLHDATLIADNPKTTMAANRYGIFTLPVTGFETTLTVSCVGYATQTFRVSNRNFQDLRLLPASVGLDEVQIVAYGKTTQRLAMASFTAIPGTTLADQPVSNLLGALEGRVSRLSIRQYNGVPGSSYETVLGGRHSIQQGNEPLYVLDGVPLPGGGFLPPTGSGSAQGEHGASALNGIPVSAIAGVEVLKDASATAIYGSRASNGVILITTKEGGPGQPRWTAEVGQGASRAVKTSPLLNTQQFLALRKEAVGNDQFPVNDSTVAEAYYWDTTRNNNFKKLTSGGTASYRDVRLGFNTGDSLTHVLISGSMHNESGVFPGATTDQRLSVYGSLHHQSVSRRLKINFSGLYNREDTHLPLEDYSSYAYLAPNAPPFTNAAGQSQWGAAPLPYQNIPALANNTYKGSVDYLFGRLQVDLALSDVLSLEGSIGGNGIETHEQSFLTIAGQDPGRVPPPTGQSFTGRNGYTSGIVELLGRYSARVGPGRLEALAGVTYQGEGADYSSTLLSGFSSDLLLASGSGAATITPASNRVYYRYEAVFGRANYNIKNKYLLTASGRRDGSSRFGPGDQFGNFWGLGAAWVFSEENFFRQWKGLSFGKLRGSYGTTGNDQIGDEQYAELYSSTNSARGYQGQQGVVPASLANNHLRWELNYREEAALDLGFWKDRVVLSAGVYRSFTKNQLVYEQLPPQAGFPGVLSNQPANVVNEGLEFLLQTNNLHVAALRYASTLTLTIPRNYLRSWPGLGKSSFAATMVQGKSLSVTRGLHLTGVSRDSGMYTFYDANHNGQVDLGDLVPSPSLDPKWYGGWSHSLQYEGWGLEIFFEYRRQNGINPLTVLDSRNPAGIEEPYQLSNGPKEWLSHWRKPGDVSLRQRLTATTGSPTWLKLQEYLGSDAIITDASFLRLKTLSLYYQFPRAWLEQRHLRELKLYLRGQNLWTRTRFPVTDPETQDPTFLPPMRTLVAGFQVSF